MTNIQNLEEKTELLVSSVAFKEGSLHLPTASSAWSTLGLAHTSSQLQRVGFSYFPTEQPKLSQELGWQGSPTSKAPWPETLQPCQLCCCWSKGFCQTTIQRAKIQVCPKVRNARGPLPPEQPSVPRQQNHTHQCWD